jgi:isohexenylglutaconyl-CoA hydratase
MATLPPDCATLALTVRGGRLDLVLNRPEQRNAINSRMMAEFSRVVDWLAGNEEIRVVVLSGAGGHFCAGGDIKERRSQSDTADGVAEIAERNRQGGLAFLAFENLPQTTIAAVEGSAFGGGMGYACLADITVVTRGARLGMPETTLGVAPAQIAPFVVRRIGLTRARQLALTGERFGGEKAYEYGIAQYLCDDDELDETVDAVVHRVMHCGPKANAATKRIMLAVGSMPGPEMAAFSAEIFAGLNRGEEGREGQSAFAEKRKPAWQQGLE